MQINKLSPQYYKNQVNSQPTNHTSTVTQPSFSGLGNLFGLRNKDNSRDVFTKNKPQQLKELNLEKLEGIQKGIEVFEGLSLKEINFICTNLALIMVNRGCTNKCSSCGVGAIPQHFKDGEDTINKMSWEDLTELTDGIKELEKRTNVALRSSDYTYPSNRFDDFTTPFLDSDCIELEIKDKNNKTYDYTDISEKLYDVIKQPLLFDTSGWAPKNQKLQHRAEKIVDYVSKNNLKMGQVNISINPFHGLNNRAIQEIIKENPKAAKKFRNLYTDRMANAIFTFTPILKNTGFITTAMNNDMATPFGLSENDLLKLLDEIDAKVKCKYNEDLNSEQKYIKHPTEIAQNMFMLRAKLNEIRIINSVGRAKNLHKPVVANSTETKRLSKMKTKLNATNAYKDTIVKSEKIIDANGKIYCRTSDTHTILPTELQLNFKNKNKETVPFVNLYKDFTVTKQMINQ